MAYQTINISTTPYILIYPPKKVSSTGNVSPSPTFSDSLVPSILLNQNSNSTGKLRRPVDSTNLKAVQANWNRGWRPMRLLEPSQPRRPSPPPSKTLAFKPPHTSVAVEAFLAAHHGFRRRFQGGPAGRPPQGAPRLTVRLRPPPLHLQALLRRLQRGIQRRGLQRRGCRRCPPPERDLSIAKLFSRGTTSRWPFPSPPYFLELGW